MDLEKLQTAGSCLMQEIAMQTDSVLATRANLVGSIGVEIAGSMLSEICHASSVAGGWWNDLTTGESLRGKRNVGELLCLIHSEISEGYEAWLDGPDTKDDHLKHRVMMEVELADALIRIGDLYGSLNLDLGVALADQLTVYKSIRGENVHVAVARIHLDISKALEGHRKNLRDTLFPHLSVMEARLGEAVIHIVEFANDQGYDLGTALAEKVAYNRNRKDHRPENRREENGKKF